MMSLEGILIIMIKSIIGLFLRSVLVLLILRLELLVVFAPGFVVLSPGFVVGFGGSRLRGTSSGARDVCAVLGGLGGVATGVLREGTGAVECGTVRLPGGARWVAASTAGGSLSAEAVEGGAAVVVG
jgi:hypothetical protein